MTSHLAAPHHRRVALAMTLIFGLVGCAGSPGGPRGSSTVDYAPPLDESSRTQILVLGTAHLSELEDCLAPTALDAVVARLAAWRPEVIAIEALPSTVIEAIEPRDDWFAAELKESFAKRSLDAGRLAAAALHRTAAEAHSALAQQPSAPSAAERVHRALLLAAGHEYPSAVLQWTYLSDAERAAAELPDELRTLFETSRAAANEVYRIAVPLAQKLGLQQLALVDDFAGEQAYAARFEELRKELNGNAEMAKVKDAPLYKEQKTRLSAACRDPQQMLAFYRWINDPAFAKVDVETQWGAWFRTRLASRLDRARYAGWEARNLAIAANIRKESSLFAGKRVLVIYGAGHKPFLDAYLAQMLDVRVVAPSSVLSTP